MHASVPSIVGLARSSSCQTEGGGRGGGGGVQSVRGKERRERRCRRETERRESEWQWRCIQPAAKTVLRHLDPSSGRVASACRSSAVRLFRTARSINRARQRRSGADARGKKIRQQCGRGEECGRKNSNSKKRCYEPRLLAAVRSRGRTTN